MNNSFNKQANDLYKWRNMEDQDILKKMSNIPSHWEGTNDITLRFHLTTARIVMSQENHQCQWARGERGAILHRSGTLTAEAAMEVSTKFPPNLTRAANDASDKATPLLGNTRRDPVSLQRDTCTAMPMAAPFMICRRGNQSRRPPRDGCAQKMWYIHATT